jgi:hypothetical protein
MRMTGAATGATTSRQSALADCAGVAPTTIPISSDEPHVQRDGLVQAAKYRRVGSGVEHENSKFKAMVFRVIAALQP